MPGGVNDVSTKVPGKSWHTGHLMAVCQNRNGDTYPLSVRAFFRTSATNASSLSDSRLISTFAIAPSIAARASAIDVVKSDFMLGFVMGPSFFAISATSLAFSATLSGTAVAWRNAAVMTASPFVEVFACLYAFITAL